MPFIAKGAKRQAEREREQQYADRIVPVKKLEAPFLAGKLARVRPRTPAEHRDEAKYNRERVAMHHKHCVNSPVPLRGFILEWVMRASQALRRVHSASKALRLGNDFCVPTPVVDMAAYRFARATASASASPSLRKTARLPIKASPAPLVSTGLTA